MLLSCSVPKLYIIKLKKCQTDHSSAIRGNLTPFPPLPAPILTWCLLLLLISKTTKLA